MCKIRGIRHAHCGHTARKCLSTCRGTYAAPHCPRVPRCSSPGPTLIMNLDQSCRQCQYQSFFDSWQERISEVKDRRDSFSSLLEDMKLSEPEPWSFDDDDDGFSFNDLHGSADMPNAFDGSIETDSRDPTETSQNLQSSHPTKPRPKSKQAYPPAEEVAHNWLDPASLREERKHLNKELADLQAQFQAENWKKWPEWMSSSMPAGFDKKKRRRTAPKIHCMSPLKEVTSADEFPDPPELLQRSSSVPESDSLHTRGWSDSGSSTSSVSVTTPIGSPPRTLLKGLRRPPLSSMKSWPETENEIRCPLMKQALSYQQSTMKEEAPMLSEEWMRNFQRLTTDEINAKNMLDYDHSQGLLPNWDE